MAIKVKMVCKKASATAVLLYGVVALILVATVDSDRMAVNRLNSLKEVEVYLAKLDDGQEALKISALERGLLYYSIMRDSMPGNPFVEGNIGFCLTHLGRMEEAFKVYRQAMRRHPHQYSFYYDAGMVRFHQRRYKEAAAWLERALYWLLKEEKRQGRLAAGIAETGHSTDILRFQRWVRTVAEDKRRLIISLGFLYQQTGQKEKAAKAKDVLPDGMEFERITESVRPHFYDVRFETALTLFKHRYHENDPQ